MSEGDWRAQYEAAAEAEARRLTRVSDQTLLDAVRNRATGDYYVLWYELGKRKATAETCWLLYEVLRSDRPYLDRYHGAAALLQLLQCKEFEAVELSAEWPVVADNLARLAVILAAKFPPPRIG